MNNFIHTNDYEPVRASRRAIPRSSIPHSPPKRNRLLLRRIDPWRGLHINGAWYWHRRFAKAGQSEPVDVLRDPFNIGVVSVRFRGDWILAKPMRSTSHNLRFEELAHLRREAAPDLEEDRMWQAVALLEMIEPRTHTEPTL